MVEDEDYLNYFFGLLMILRSDLDEDLVPNYDE